MLYSIYADCKTHSASLQRTLNKRKIKMKTIHMPSMALILIVIGSIVETIQVMKNIVGVIK